MGGRPCNCCTVTELCTCPDDGAARAQAPGCQRSSCGSVRRGRGGDCCSQRRRRCRVRIQTPQIIWGGTGWIWDVCDLGSCVRLPWLDYDEAPGPYITIPQYCFNKTKQHTRGGQRKNRTRIQKRLNKWWRNLWSATNGSIPIFYYWLVVNVSIPRLLSTNIKVSYWTELNLNIIVSKIVYHWPMLLN